MFYRATRVVSRLARRGERKRLVLVAKHADLILNPWTSVGSHLPTTRYVSKRQNLQPESTSTVCHALRAPSLPQVTARSAIVNSWGRDVVIAEENE
jgi:hypothetical protein